MNPIRITILRIVSICILFNISTFASSDVGLDLKGGINFSNIHGNDIDKAKNEGVDFKINFGANGGIGLRIDFRKYFSIQHEIFFAMKGYTSEIEGAKALGISYGETKLSSTYLEFPVLFKISIPAGPVIPNFYLGPYLGFLLNAQLKGKIQLTNSAKALLGIENLNNTIDVKDNLKPMDFGLSMGSGIGIKAGPGRIIMDIRYSLGIINIREPGHNSLSGEELLEDDMKNGSFSLIIGYGIDIGNH